MPAHATSSLLRQTALSTATVLGLALAACGETRVGANISDEEARGEASVDDRVAAERAQPPPSDPTPTGGTPAVQRGDPAQETEAADGLQDRRPGR